VPPKATRTHVRTLLARLSRLAAEADGEPHTNAAAALQAIAERIPRRALVVVISDLFESTAGADATIRALRHLRHRGHEVVVFHLLDAATEQRFDFEDRPIRVRDLETGEERTLQPAQVREGYRAASEAFIASVRRACREAGVDYELLDTARPYADALRAYLDKRRRLY
jgi:hypothetical protein